MRPFDWCGGVGNGPLLQLAGEVHIAEAPPLRYFGYRIEKGARCRGKGLVVWEVQCTWDEGTTTMGKWAGAWGGGKEHGVGVEIFQLHFFNKIMRVDDQFVAY